MGVWNKGSLCNIKIRVSHLGFSEKKHIRGPTTHFYFWQGGGEMSMAQFKGTLPILSQDPSFQKPIRTPRGHSKRFLQRRMIEKRLA